LGGERGGRAGRRDHALQSTPFRTSDLAGFGPGI
jgi:hypothetical protein